MVKTLSLQETAEFFAARRARADMGAFHRLLNRSGGEPPRLGDELLAAPDRETERAQTRSGKRGRRSCR